MHSFVCLNSCAETSTFITKRRTKEVMFKSHFIHNISLAIKNPFLGTFNENIAISWKSISLLINFSCYERLVFIDGRKQYLYVIDFHVARFIMASFLHSSSFLFIVFVGRRRQLANLPISVARGQGISSNRPKENQHFGAYNPI